MPLRLVLPALTALVLTVAAIGFARSAELAAGDLHVTAAWAVATPGKVAAAYVTIENRGDRDDTLQGASSPVAASVAIHETKEEAGIVTMRPLENPAIPAGGRLEMAPGRTHLMLNGLAAPLKAGETVEVTLAFAMAGTLTVPVKVVPLGQDVSGHDHSM
jgi:periplasmic copper chaperone A